MQWRVLRGARLAAARDGKRIKEALERALALDPGMADAYFGIGLYHYYADCRAGRPLRMLRWLLLLPGGDRAGGLEEMRPGRDGRPARAQRGRLPAAPLYLWYEKQPERALELLADLVERHPRNPHFPQAIAEIQDFYSRRHGREPPNVAGAARRRAAGRVAEPQMAEDSARLGIASQLDQLSQSEAALEHLRAVIARGPPRRSAPSRARTCSSATRSSISADAARRLRRTARRSWPLAPTIHCGSHRARALRCARDAMKFCARRSDISTLDG